MKSSATSLALALMLVAASSGPAGAQSEVSAAVSMLPVASVLGTASVAGASVAAVSAAPLVLSAAGAVFTIKAVEASARSTVYLLERASDGARFSVKVAASTVGTASLAVGSVVTASVIGAGVVLSAAGEAIAFIPNAIGRALLHNERVAF